MPAERSGERGGASGGPGRGSPRAPASPPGTGEGAAPVDPSEPTAVAYSPRRIVGLVAGLVPPAVTLLVPPPVGLGADAWHVAGVALLMAIWWISEALPIPATALIPVALFPLLGVFPVSDAARPYANPVIFLFMGGFLIGLAMQRWNLHLRIALSILRHVGDRPTAIVGGFMAATAFLSMWVSNTAATIMMLPIGISVLGLVGERVGDKPGDAVGDNLGVALMLGIAYAASIGGVATLIGTPPNAMLAAFLDETYSVDLGFGRWMLVGLPVVALLLPATWLILTRLVFPVSRERVAGTRALLAEELRRLGPMRRGERVVAVVAALTACLWVSRPYLAARFPQVAISDAGIAMTSALLLFAFPVDIRRGVFALNWEWARRLPWDVLVLFGGGLSLAAAISRTGLADWIGGAMAGLEILPLLTVILVVTGVIVFLTELTSNTATAAAFLPVVAALAVSLGENPYFLVVPAALAASCAFMLPVATPPNAIVFGSGRVTVPQMARCGVVLNFLSILAVTAVAYGAVIAVLGAEPGVVPDWARPG